MFTRGQAKRKEQPDPSNITAGDKEEEVEEVEFVSAREDYTTDEEKEEEDKKPEAAAATERLIPIWTDDDTMKEDKTEPETDLELEDGELLPNRQPDIMEILIFKREVANAAARYGIERLEKGGYADLVESLSKFQERLGDPNASPPPIPIYPTEPDYVEGPGKAVEYQIKYFA